MITLTTEQGQFSFPDVDGSGPSDLFVDGAVATMLNGQPIPTGSFPFLHYTPVLVPNAANALAAPAMLPPLDPCNQVIYDGSQDVTLTIRMRDPATPTCDPQQSGCCIPAIEGLEMLVKAGTTIRRPDGKCVGPDASCSGPDDIGQMTLALNQVHHDDVPMPMPDGAAPPFAWTLQPGGSTFDIPVQVTYPNMSALPAGSIAYFLSFDHDANKFQVIATGHVSGDGASIITDPNAGITKAGWGCNCPPYSVTGKCCTGCGDVCCDGVCCSSTCCANGQTCCGGSCCDGQCCAGVCCAGAGTCCEGSCCADGQTCCGSTCCASGEECCIDQCVPEEDCGASSVTQTLSVTFPGLDLFTNALETAAEAAPMISSMELSVSASISAESGETCCECTEPTGAGPFGYTDYAASVSADLEITFNIPGWAWDVGFTFSGYGSIAGMVTLGPTVTLTPSAGVSVAGRDIPEADCPEECTRVDGTANIGLQVLFGGSATVTVSVEPTWIWDGWGTSVEATAQAGVGTSAGISGTYRLSNCSAPGFSTDGICFGDLEGVVVLKFVIFGTEFSYQATAQFLEGGCW
jgi:hypothetical protein